MIHRNFEGFTLAEVLITLGIIGVVAAMTLPALVQNYKEKQTVTAVKTAYSTFSQAYLMVVSEYDSLANLVDPAKTNKENAKRAFDEISKHIKKFKNCNNDDSCMPDVYKTLDGRTRQSWDSYNNVQTGVLANGTSFWILNTFTNEEFDGQIGIDINGRKQPNQYGIDFFIFNVKANGQVVPSGIGVLTDDDLKDKYTSYERCDINNTTDIYNGYWCTSWILQHENMDYLKRSIAGEE